MTTAVIDTVGLAHLIAVIERCRNDWDPPGIRRALEQTLARHPYPNVALVAIASARDPKARTPAVISVRCDQGMTITDTTEAPTRTPTRIADLRCDRCGFWVVTGETHECQRRADPEVAAAYAAAARTAAKDAARPKETM